MRSFVRNIAVPFVVSAIVVSAITYLVIVAIHRFSPNVLAVSLTHSLLTGSDTPSDDAILAFLPANDAIAQGACGCPYCCSLNN